MGELTSKSRIGFVTLGNYVAGFALWDLPGTVIQRDIAIQIESLCGSLIIESWTLFESLCEDLWEAAVNVRPSRLGVLSGGKTSVSFDDLQRNGFDVRGKMGSF